MQYPLSDLKYRDMGRGQNVLLITVDGLNYSRYESKCLPRLNSLRTTSYSLSI